MFGRLMPLGSISRGQGLDLPAQEREQLTDGHERWIAGDHDPGAPRVSPSLNALSLIILNAIAGV